MASSYVKKRQGRVFVCCDGKYNRTNGCVQQMASVESLYNSYMQDTCGDPNRTTRQPGLNSTINQQKMASFVNDMERKQESVRNGHNR